LFAFRLIQGLWQLLLVSQPTSSDHVRTSTCSSTCVLVSLIYMGYIIFLYFLYPIESVVFLLSFVLFKIFLYKYYYSVMTYFIIRDTLIMIYLFYYLHKNFE
jgi:hypothetical protein